MEFAEMAMMRLNAQVRQFGGFTPGGRVFGRTQKMSTGAVGNPHFADFMNPVGAPTTKSHHSIGVIQQTRQASLIAYFSGKLNSALRQRIPESKMGNSFYARRFRYRQIGWRKVKDGG